MSQKDIVKSFREQHLPTCSWWICAVHPQSRFYARAKAEQLRMQLSPAGSSQQNFQAGRPQALKAGV